MKACFLLQRKFAYLGHKISLILKDKYGVNEFCGYVEMRPSFEFLKKQKDINYSSLILDEDIHNRYKQEKLDLEFIKNFEKKYGLPNLWPYITADRVIMHNQLVREYPYNQPPYSHEEIIRIFQVQAKAVNKFLDKEKPDFLFMSVFGSIGSCLLLYLAKRKGIKVLTGSVTRINVGYTITTDYKKFSEAEILFDELARRGKNNRMIVKARGYINNFRQRPSTYHWNLKDKKRIDSRLEELKWFNLINIKNFIRWYLKLCFKALTDKNQDYSEERPFGSLLDKVRRKIRLLIGFKYFYDEVSLEEDFAFFPLHLEPEVTVSLMAPFYEDQINLIKQIARSLPLHFKLYVKEHPAMIGYRPQAYYRELKKIPNVKIINPNVKSFELIKETKLIATLTGTVGWEGTILKKPVITFGDVFYNKLSWVKKCESLKELPYIIKSQLENFQYNEQELENFIAAIMETSVDIDLMKIWNKGIEPDLEKQRLTKLADLIAEKLELKPIK